MPNTLGHWWDKEYIIRSKIVETYIDHDEEFTMPYIVMGNLFCGHHTAVHCNLKTEQAAIEWDGQTVGDDIMCSKCTRAYYEKMTGIDTNWTVREIQEYNDAHNIPLESPV